MVGWEIGAVLIRFIFLLSSDSGLNQLQGTLYTASHKHVLLYDKKLDLNYLDPWTVLRNFHQCGYYTYRLVKNR
jgi:hypothetical protein